MKNYNHKIIEPKWQKEWKGQKLYKTEDNSKKPKSYVLDMFPYPSGEGLHVGHPKGYIATDIYSRYKKMNGFNVLHPMGWDAFGLPAENFAIKNKVHPRAAVEKNIARYKEQLGKIGFNYDWEKEINTTDPKYYKWTQWVFLQMFKKGLAYESNEPINWCPKCMTGLANEDLDGDECERCGSVVEQKPIRQWVLKITDYADRMLEDLDELDWPESIKESQRNWIGRSEGAEIEFGIKNQESRIKIFTTRPDTLFGATYCVLSPEHKLIDELKNQIENWDEVEKYREDVAKKTEIERVSEGKEKTGVELKGLKAINPANNEDVPIFIADYVLAHYGTGAIMAVPAHDERDLQFALKFDISIKPVIAEVKTVEEIFPGLTESKIKSARESGFATIGPGLLFNSGKFDDMYSEEAKKAIVRFVKGKTKTTYKLRDWVFSRQRYWGEPIPVIRCEKCGVVPVPENQLPVVLPEVDSYEPTGTGESPLANIDEWVNVECPKCGEKGKRETNTMPQWAGSSWYYLRYIDPNNDNEIVDKKKEKYWSPVDMYVGGAEHATRHLIYARFWHKFLYDIGVVSYKEPFKRLQHVGLIGAEDGRKMSKRYGNVVNPDDVIAIYGADTLRVYEMFMGPFDQGVVWSTESIIGSRRFLEKVWRLSSTLQPTTNNQQPETVLHKTIKKVEGDIESFDFNTAISQMMIFINEAEKNGVTKEQYEIFLKLLAPFAPHITEELWQELGHTESVHLPGWPKHDKDKVKEKSLVIAIQVNGKVRGELEISIGESDENIKDRALLQENVEKWIKDKEVKKVIYVKNKLVNVVI